MKPNEPAMQNDPRVEAACRAVHDFEMGDVPEEPAWDAQPEEVKDYFRRQLACAIAAADAATPSPWRPISEAPHGRTLLLLGLMADSDGIAYDIQEVRRTGYFHIHWQTCEGERFIPRLWCEMPDMPDNAMTFPPLPEQEVE